MFLIFGHILDIWQVKPGIGKPPWVSIRKYYSIRKIFFITTERYAIAISVVSPLVIASVCTFRFTMRYIFITSNLLEKFRCDIGHCEIIWFRNVQVILLEKKIKAINGLTTMSRNFWENILLQKSMYIINFTFT